MSTASVETRSPKNRWAVMLVWIAIALLCIAELVSFGDPLSAAVQFVALTLLPAAVLSVPVWMLMSREPWSRVPSPVALATHLATALLFSVLLVALEIGAATLVHASAVRPFLMASMGVGALTGTAIYGAIVGVSVAIRTRNALHAERIAFAREHAEAADARAALAAAELAMMRAKLDPHFLFNALHGISELVRADPAEADSAIEELGHMLRAATATDQSGFASLDEEMALARTYLGFERRRLRHALEAAFEIGDDTRFTLVPRLLVQPLLENAIRHGVLPAQRPCRITVRANRTASHVEIVVADDGRGCQEVNWSGAGVGLVDLRRRLAAHYGDRASLEVQTARDAGFEVRVQLPVSSSA